MSQTQTPPTPAPTGTGADFTAIFSSILGNLGGVRPGGQPGQGPPIIVTGQRETDYTGIIFLGIIFAVVFIAIYRK